MILSSAERAALARVFALLAEGLVTKAFSAVAA
jgi:hypothetical protein